MSGWQRRIARAASTTAAVGEAHVHQAGIGPVRGHGRDAIGDTRRDGQYLMTACLEDRGESLAHNAVVVTQDKSHLPPPFRP